MQSNNRPMNGLLNACKDATSPQNFLDRIVETYGPYNTLTPRLLQEDAAKKDTEERNFLHILSLNENLLSSLDITNDGIYHDIVVDIINTILIPANPDVICEQDANGYLPFEESLKEWVQIVHASTVAASVDQSGGQDDSENMLINQYHTTLPPQQESVTITAEIKSNLFLLSSILENLYTNQQRSHPKHSRLSNLGFSTSQLFDSSSKNISQSTQEQDARSQEIIIRLATTPGFIKLIVLLDNDDDWSWMLNCSVIRSVMMRRESIEGWLVVMLCSDQKRQNCAIEYLVQLSILFDEKKEESNVFARNFTHRQFREVCKKIRHLDGLIPSISALDKTAVSHLASTSIIENVLDKVMVSTSSLSLVFFDSIFLSLLIFSFRRTVRGYLVRSRDEFVDWTAWIQVTNGFLFYFFVRFLMKSISTLAKMNLFFLLKTWLLNILSLIDLLAFLLACSSSIIMRTTFLDFKLGESNVQLEQFILAATTWFLWLKWAGIIQGLHEKAAFYVQAFWEITKDVMWFTVVLIAHGWCFQQVTFTMLVPAECQAGQINSRDCSPAEYFVTAYSVMAGEFLLTEDRDKFKSILSILGFIIFSFVVMILLLNILIAVITDSYEKCLAQSGNFFGYARLTVVTEVLIFQTIFGGGGNHHTQNWEKGRCLFLSTFLGGAFIWIGIEIFLLYQSDITIFPSIVSVLVTAPVTYVAITSISLPGRLKYIFKILFKPIKYAMKNWVVTRRNFEELYVGNNDGKRWRGRILRLESQIKKSEKSVKKEIEASERRTMEMLRKKMS